MEEQEDAGRRRISVRDKWSALPTNERTAWIGCFGPVLAAVLAALIGGVFLFFSTRTKGGLPEPSRLPEATPTESVKPVVTSSVRSPAVSKAILPEPGLSPKTPHELTEFLAGVPTLMKQEAAQKLLGIRVSFDGELQPAGGMNGGRFEMFVWEILPSGSVDRSHGIGFFVDDLERYPGIQTLRPATRIHVEGVVEFAAPSGGYRLRDVRLKY